MNISDCISTQIIVSISSIFTNIIVSIYILKNNDKSKKYYQINRNLIIYHKFVISISRRL